MAEHCDRTAIVNTYGSIQHQNDCKLAFTGAQSFQLGDVGLAGVGLLLVALGVGTRQVLRHERWR